MHACIVLRCHAASVANCNKSSNLWAQRRRFLHMGSLSGSASAQQPNSWCVDDMISVLGAVFSFATHTLGVELLYCRSWVSTALFLWAASLSTDNEEVQAFLARSKCLGCGT